MRIIADINMGYKNKLREVYVSNSKKNLLILQALHRGGLISSFSTDFLNPLKCCVFLNLGHNFLLKQVSRPGLRRYIHAQQLKEYKSPFYILSTTHGLLTPHDLMETTPYTGGELLLILKNK